MPLWVDPKTFDKTCLAYADRLPGMVPYSEYIQGYYRRLKMEQVIQAERVYVTCKLCGSTNVVKDGVRNGVQYYWCKNCSHKFAGTKALPDESSPRANSRCGKPVL